VEQGLELDQLSYGATAIKLNTPLTSKISKILKALGVQYVQRRPQAPNDIGLIQKHYPMTHTVRGYLIDWLLRLPGATPKLASTTNTMEVEASAFMSHGEKIGRRFLNMFRHLMGGINPNTKWTELTTTRGTSQTTYGLCQEAKTCKTEEGSKNYRKKLMTYDLAYAGPRNRFTILTQQGPIIVHNCGYGMGAQKFHNQLKTFGKDVPIEACDRIIDVYRKTYGRIQHLWDQGQRCLSALFEEKSETFGYQPQAIQFIPFFGFRLPNGMFMRYPQLKRIWGQANGYPQYEYKSGRYGFVRVYGGKVVENVTQAIARCVVGEQMLRVAKRYKVVLTVHDAVACIAKEEEAEEAVAYVEECMKWRPDWCLTLPLNCETHYGKTYG
jgi:hypothetical protein